MKTRLDAGQKAGTEPTSGCSYLQGAAQIPAVCQTACRKQRNVSGNGCQVIKQRKQGLLPPDVSSGLNPLGYQNVCFHIHRTKGFIRRTDGEGNIGTGLMNPSNQVPEFIGMTVPKKGNQPCPAL